jgi:probable F420-dependent oxidoreductase
MTHSRPIRFGTGAARLSDPTKLVAAARRAETLGFSTFALPDHLMMPFAPLITLQAVADATTTLRVGQLVLVQDFRHPAVLAKELATLDVFSGGRVEVGIGAGWMPADFEQSGIPFDSAAVRIERLEEAVIVLRGLFGKDPFSFSGRHFTITGLDGTPKPVQRPHPPIMIGGGGPKLLAVAARQADIIQLLPGPNTGTPSVDFDRLTPRAYLEKVDLIRAAAGPRFDSIELGALLLDVTVTDDPDRAADEFLARLGVPGGGAGAGGPSRDDVFSSPVVAIGSLPQVCDKLLAVRERFGFSYFTGPVGTRAESLGPVIERLAAS